jgi:hypothetical protein
MNLIEQAEADLSFTLEDKDNGFGVALQFQDATKTYVELVCQTTDIGFFQDMDTGMGIIGRTVEVVFRLSSSIALNIPYPTKGTIVKYFTTAGVESKLKVQDIAPDRKIGVIKLTMEIVKNGG